jgi:hypothetical protein
MSDYAIHLSFNNFEEGFQIPVNPVDSLQVSHSGQGKSYNIVGRGGGTEETRAGEINVIESPKLVEISFSSEFPSQMYPYVVTKPLHEPKYYINIIEKWWASRHPIRFIYTWQHSTYTDSRVYTDRFEINKPVSIESFEWKEVGGSPGDLEYTLKLKEYVFYSARKIIETKDSAGNPIFVQQPPERPDERILPETYTTKEGDSLWLISRRFYDTDQRIDDIKKLNNLTDLDVIELPPKLVLKLPAV